MRLLRATHAHCSSGFGWNASVLLTSPTVMCCDWSGERKSTSLCVMRPSSRPPMRPLSVTGIPVNPNRFFASITSPTVLLADMTSGSRMKPCSYFCSLQDKMHEGNWMHHKNHKNKRLKILNTVHVHVCNQGKKNESKSTWQETWM